jgi:hypothetical protein
LVVVVNLLSIFIYLQNVELQEDGEKTVIMIVIVKMEHLANSAIMSG